MSLFDAAKRMMGSDAVKEMVAKECGDHPMIGHAVDMVNSRETGGVQGLVEKFRAQGLGHIVDSWMGPGGNHPITADEIQRVLGQDRINAIASRFGMSPEDASAKLAQVLPTVVSKMAGGAGETGSNAAA